MSGFRLSLAAAAKLERRIESNPSDLEARLPLLGYYFGKSHSSKVIAAKHLKSVVWLITNAPDHQAFQHPPAWIEKTIDSSGYERCKVLWLKQLHKYADSVAVITNAARFLRFDWRLSEKLYKRAIALDPANYVWSRDLAWRLRRVARKNSPMAMRALNAMQDALQKIAEPEDRRHLYDDLANIAFSAGEWSIAEAAARKSVWCARKFPPIWDTGNEIHNGNCVLGRLALRRGDLKKARHYLKEAAKTPGSPQLNSFGPDLTFAREMLRAGQRDSVIEYLNACKRFWSGKEKALADCVRQIELGKSPRLQRHSF